jgi:hypothetical protein
LRMLIDNLFDADGDALIVVCGDRNADLDEVPVEAIRGGVENTLSLLIAAPWSRADDRSLAGIPRCLLADYRGSELHNELLHDEFGGLWDRRELPGVASCASHRRV